MKNMGKQKLFIAAGVLLFIVSGCGKKAEENQEIPQNAEVREEYSEKEQMGEDRDSDGESIAELYRDIYEQAVEMGTVGELEVTRRIVERIGEYGYAVVDEENQIDMVGSEQVLRFCRSVEEAQDDKLTIIAVTSSGGFIKYDLHTAEGAVNVTRGYYQYSNGILKNLSTVSYPAESWEYTEEGYLLFEGSYYSKEYYLLALDETPECAALRVEPLDSKCREFNRTCILPVGYRQNNIFLVDWSEEDFGELDFYDAFDRFYPLLYDRAVPYTEDENLGVGAVYGIKEEEFETVVQAFIEVGSQELRVNTVYDPQRKAYEYKPRGFEEKEYPQIPYPEVVSSEERADGTIALTVHAVYPEGNTSRAFSHQTVIRPREDGGFCFVSNRRIFSDQDQSAWWHSDRLSAEKWNEIYGEND